MRFAVIVLVGLGACAWVSFDGGPRDDRAGDGVPEARDADPTSDGDAGSDASLPECDAAVGSFRDADHDGWGGAPACATDTTTVDRAGDCDDSDASVNPHAHDVPDADFVDADCDGIDGDPTEMLFVAPDGSDDSGDGTRDRPFASIGRALAVAAQGPIAWHLAISAGRYDERVDLVQGVSIHGGYSRDDGWSRGPDHETTIFSSLAADGRIVGVSARDVAVETIVEAVGVLAASTDATGTSVVGVWAVDSPGLVLRAVRVVAGDAGDGADGAAGIAGADGSAGGPGGRGSCNVDDPGSGGYGGTNDACPEANGGRGGNGGGDDERGRDGSPSAGGAAGGTGGSAGHVPAGGGCCNQGDPGTVGDPGGVGSAGPDGAGGRGVGAVAGELWTGERGEDGAPGVSGVGGGGGGGGGGEDTYTDDNEGGANGGGGGGAGGCGGAPGTGGAAGGGSIAVLAVRSPGLRIERSSLVSGVGGAGGAGGAGAAAGRGADGGLGATYCPDDLGEGGNGGPGGDGGASGAGGGGGGGVSYPLFCHAGAVILVEPVALEPGDGGPGGASPANAGSPGGSGESFGCSP